MNKIGLKNDNLIFLLEHKKKKKSNWTVELFEYLFLQLKKEDCDIKKALKQV